MKFIINLYFYLKYYYKYWERERERERIWVELETREMCNAQCLPQSSRCSNSTELTYTATFANCQLKVLAFHFLWITAMPFPYPLRRAIFNSMDHSMHVSCLIVLPPFINNCLFSKKNLFTVISHLRILK